LKKLLLLLLLLSVFQSNSQNSEYLLTQMPFNSDIGLLDSSGFNFTKNYTNSNSFWAIDSFSESSVFKAEMSYVSNIDIKKNYNIRIGKGGQLYSFKGNFGESVPPQWVHPNWVDSSYGGGTSYAPWVDEVWQMVCVDGTQHNPPDSMYFIHQAGVYLKTSSQNKPFFSPQVAEYFDSLNNSYTTVNWGQQAHTNTISNTGFTSSLLYYTRYTNLGNGILQVDNMIYNFGNDNITFLNMPWGGVRNSSLEHFFISTPSDSYVNSPGLYGLGPVVQTASTGGWVAWSNDTLGNSATLAMAHPITTNTNGNVFRYGDAGNLNANWNERDYHVFEMIRFPSSGQLGFGSSMSFRYFYVLGQNIESVKNTISNYNLVSESLDTAYTASINDVDSIRYRFVQHQGIITTIPDTSGSALLLRTNPYNDSYPLFKIRSSDSTDYISSDPYCLSSLPWDGVTESINLLGFLNNPSIIIVINDTVCAFDSYTFPDGHTTNNITSDFTYSSILSSNINSWDSIVVTNIFISCSIIGCTDSTACNYDTFATSDDGSCEYTSCATCIADAITGLFFSGIIDDRAVANFDNMNAYDSNGTQICRVDQIRIKYRELGANNWSQKNIASPIGYDTLTGICNSSQKTDKNIYNLIPATEYEWQVKLWYCSTGATSWVVGPNFTTLGECSNVGSLSAYGANPNKATFNWDDSNGGYEFVRIKMRVDSISNPIGSDWFNVGGAGVSYPTFTKNKSGLVPGETYRGQARTWCDPQGGAYNSLGWTPLITWTQPTSNRIDGADAISNLDIYPNPSRDIFNVSFTSEDVQDLKVRIINLIGEELVNENLKQFIGEYTKQIDLTKNAKGIYFLEIETNDGLINKKLILQ